MSVFIGTLVVVVLTYFLLEILNFVLNQVLKVKFGETNDDKAKKRELATYQEELNSCSMVDEFPKYARIERKINEIKSYFTRTNKDRSQSLFMWKMILNCFCTVFGVIIYLVFIYMYQSKAAISINSKWTYPISDLLAYPSSESNVVSVVLWMLICRTTFGQAVHVLKTSHRVFAVSNK